MTVLTPRLNMMFFPNVNMLCQKVSVMHKQDSTKKFRVCHTRGGLWRLIVE